jgi:hypothetical protein
VAALVAVLVEEDGGQDAFHGSAVLERDPSGGAGGRTDGAAGGAPATTLAERLGVSLVRVPLADRSSRLDTPARPANIHPLG